MGWQRHQSCCNLQVEGLFLVPFPYLSTPSQALIACNTFYGAEVQVFVYDEWHNWPQMPGLQKPKEFLVWSWESCSNSWCSHPFRDAALSACVNEPLTTILPWMVSACGSAWLSNKQMDCMIYLMEHNNIYWIVQNTCKWWSLGNILYLYNPAQPIDVPEWINCLKFGQFLISSWCMHRQNLQEAFPSTSAEMADTWYQTG